MASRQLEVGIRHKLRENKPHKGGIRSDLLLPIPPTFRNDGYGRAFGTPVLVWAREASRERARNYGHAVAAGSHDRHDGEGAIGGPQRRSHQVGIPNAEALGPATGKGQRGGVAHGRVLTETAARTFSVSPLAAREAMRDRAAGARTGEAVVRRITPRGGHEAVGRLSLARGPDDLRAYHRGPQDVSDLHFARHAMVASVGSELDGRLSLLPAGRRRQRDNTERRPH